MKVLTTGRIRDLGQKYENGGQTRKRKKERETKLKEVKKLKATACKKISRFFSNANEQLTDLTSIQSLSYGSQAVEASRATSLSIPLSELFIIFSVVFASETVRKFYSMLSFLKLISK